MNTWILCCTTDRARLFQTNDIQEGVNYLWDIPSEEGRDFLEKLASKMDEACKADIFDYLILCGEKPLIDEISDRVDEHTRSSIIGTVPQDVFNINESDLASYIRDFLERDHPKSSRFAA